MLRGRSLAPSSPPRPWLRKNSWSRSADSASAPLPSVGVPAPLPPPPCSMAMSFCMLCWSASETFLPEASFCAPSPLSRIEVLLKSSEMLIEDEEAFGGDCGLCKLPADESLSSETRLPMDSSIFCCAARAAACGSRGAAPRPSKKRANRLDRTGRPGGKLWWLPRRHLLVSWTGAHGGTGH